MGRRPRLTPAQRDQRRTGGSFARGGRGARYGALRRHAVPDERNQPLRCHAGLPELRGDVRPAPPAVDGLVCFPDRDAALTAAREMHTPAEPFQCRRRSGTGPDGHWHLPGAAT